MKYNNSNSFANILDQNDPLRAYQEKFYYPKNKYGDDLIYFSGNSLGLQPKSVRTFVEKELDVWERKGLLGQHSRWKNFHENFLELNFLLFEQNSLL